MYNNQFWLKDKRTSEITIINKYSNLPTINYVTNQKSAFIEVLKLFNCKKTGRIIAVNKFIMLDFIFKKNLIGMPFVYKLSGGTLGGG